MGTRFWLMISVVAGSFVASTQVQLPTVNPQTQFSSGQDVVPVFEGWLRNTDGTFTFVFGYFNRNWKEEPEQQLEYIILIVKFRALYMSCSFDCFLLPGLVSRARPGRS